MNKCNTHKLAVAGFAFALTFSFSILTFQSYSQGVGINNNGNAADPSAMLDVSSTTEGALLLPRMTASQITAISGAVTGLMAFNTDCQTIVYYNGVSWVAIGNVGSVTTPGTITAGASACANSSNVTYSITGVTGASGYVWTVPSGATINSGQGTTGINVTFGTVTGNVCVTANTICGTSLSSCLAMGKPILVSAAATPNPVCAGSPLSLAASGSNMTGWSWTGPNTYSNATQNPTIAAITAAGAGVYSVTISNSCGSASATSTASVTVNPIPTITLGTNPSICSGVTSANLPYSATTQSPTQYSITYSTAAHTAGFVDVTLATLPATQVVLVVPSAAAVAAYTGTLYVTNANGCTSSGSAFTVTINALPTVSITTNPICVGSTTTLSPTSGGTWASNSTGIATVAAHTATGVAGGSVTFTFTNTAAPNCTNTTASLTVNALPSVSIAGANSTICVGSTTTLSPAGSGTWVSNTPAKATVTTPGGIVTGVAAGTSTFKYTDGNGCINTTSAVTVVAAKAVLTAAGSFTVPAGVTNLYVWAVGGGGSGAGSSTTTTTAGGGGGAGGLVYLTFTVVPTQSISYTVGTAGAAPTAGGNNGNTGGNSTVTYGSITITAYGGSPGTYNSINQASGGSYSSGNGENGSAGGTGAGVPASANTGGGGGGGLCGGNATNNASPALTGTAGSAWGADPYSLQPILTTLAHNFTTVGAAGAAGAVGGAATGYGCGGGGGGSNTTGWAGGVGLFGGGGGGAGGGTAAKAGGAGGAGFVVIEY